MKKPIQLIEPNELFVTNDSGLAHPTISNTKSLMISISNSHSRGKVLYYISTGNIQGTAYTIMYCSSAKTIIMRGMIASLYSDSTFELGSTLR